MTEALVEGIGTDAWQRELSSALNFICATLSAYDAATKGTSPLERLDVERVFAAVELLAERRDLEVTPFVASWHPAVDQWDQTRPSGVGLFDSRLQRWLTQGQGSAQQLITALIRAVTGAEAKGEMYRRLAQRMLEVLKALVAVTPKQLGYLKPLIDQGRREQGLTVATLNYDLAIERGGEAWGVPVSTGIGQWIATGRWGWQASGIRLLKLHGSIDWQWRPLGGTDGDLPRKVVTVLNPLDTGTEDAGDPVLVFGQRGKLRAEGPFLSLLAEFEKQLADATRLIVIGYSFRDDHVNELIRRWAAEDRARTLLVVDPSWPSPGPFYSNDFRIELARHLIPPDREPDAFKPRLTVWQMTCGEALQHLARLGFDGELPAAPADGATSSPESGS
jgi:hypothetical protein